MMVFFYILSFPFLHTCFKCQSLDLIITVQFQQQFNGNFVAKNPGSKCVDCPTKTRLTLSNTSTHFPCDTFNILPAHSLGLTHHLPQLFLAHIEPLVSTPHRKGNVFSILHISIKLVSLLQVSEVNIKLVILFTEMDVDDLEKEEDDERLLHDVNWSLSFLVLDKADRH